MHLLIGFFMISNTQIFSDHLAFEVTNLPSRLESLAVSFFTTSERFQSAHAIIEFAAFGLILLVFVIVKVIKLVGGDLYHGLAEITSCKGCFKEDAEDALPGEGFSNNIFKEMGIKDLKKEYKRIKNDKYRYRAHILK